jgi:hypothetical protein
MKELLKKLAVAGVDTSTDPSEVRYNKKSLLSKQLSKESKIVSKDSMEILAEFEKLNDEG